MQTEYHLICSSSGKVLHDSTDTQTENLPLAHPHSKKAALLRSVYKKKQITFGKLNVGMRRFSDWLPVNKEHVHCSAPIAYKSTGFASSLGLKNLYISFSGYWPERSAYLKTASFKECEAASVLNRFPHKIQHHSLVLASAGNTARAFIHLASQIDFPLLVVVPEKNLPALWLSSPQGKSVRILALKQGDYYDAIAVAQEICRMESYIPEGGAKNVARRDGMGTSFLAGVECMGRIPHHYFQAVGSGTGAIAAWEATLRLHEDGRWQHSVPMFHLSQNAPFLLLYNSWKERSRSLVSLDDTEGRAQVNDIYAKVLANRNPPYSIYGGLYDALCATQGSMYAIENEQAKEAEAIFEEKENIDIDPAAAVACASLIAAVKEKKVAVEDFILLNITGGGMKRLQKDCSIHHATPTFSFSLEEHSAIRDHLGKKEKGI